jgi:hypothetical protein
MTNAELHRAIRALAEELADGVIRLLVTLPLHKLAPAVDRDAPPATTPRARPAARAPKPPRTKSARGKAPRTAPSNARRLSVEILSVLVRSKAWMTAEGIKRELAAAPDRHAISQALRVLYDDELIAKRGATRATEYQVTRKGLDAST